MPTIQDFHHHISGQPEGEWVVFLHGLLGYGANWRRITPKFEEKYRVLVFDQRGHGRSFKPREGYRPEDYADDVLFLMDHFKIPWAYLVGHSMGGRNALCFSTSHPERVRKLVIEDIGPDAQPESIARMRRLLGSVPVPFADKLQAKEFFLNRFEDVKLGQYLYSNLTTVNESQIGWQFDIEAMVKTVELGRSQDRWNEWEALQCPTLLVRGEKSEELSQATYQEMLRRSRAAQGVEIKNAGHWVHAEKSDEFSKVVLSFLEKGE